jgi:hypothetical protein
MFDHCWEPPFDLKAKKHLPFVMVVGWERKHKQTSLHICNVTMVVENHLHVMTKDCEN